MGKHWGNFGTAYSMSVAASGSVGWAEESPEHAPQTPAESGSGTYPEGMRGCTRTPPENFVSDRHLKWQSHSLLPLI